MIKILLWKTPTTNSFYWRFASITVVTLLLHSASLFSYFDLESLAQDFVLGTQQIVVPQHPNAFNASIVRWRGSLLMSFREIAECEDPLTPVIYSSGNSLIGLLWLNDDFEPLGSAQILQLVPEGEFLTPFSRAEDARLITLNDRLYIIYSDNRNPVITEGGFRVYIAELDFDGESFVVLNVNVLNDFEGAKAKRREKNWTPFDYNGNLLLTYSISPHRILRHQPGTARWEKFAESNPATPWYCGELRGGTPALKINEHQYLGFFHSSMMLATEHSRGEQMLHYFMGAYIFNAAPPFNITHLSDEPIIGKQFYHGKMYEPYWGPVRVVFPCGFVFDEHNIWVTYGRQDHEIWICKLDRKGLLNSLMPLRF